MKKKLEKFAALAKFIEVVKNTPAAEFDKKYVKEEPDDKEQKKDGKEE